MPEKIEWEVVDAPLPNKQRTAQDSIKAMLGPWWRWKLISAVASASLVLLLFAMLTGMVLFTLAAGVIVTISIGKLRRHLRRAVQR